MGAARISPCILVLSLVAVVPSTSHVRAADHEFATNIVYRVLSVEEVNGHLVIEAEGTGQSSLLGTVMAFATVTQSEVPDPCFSYSADFFLIFLNATVGTIDIHSSGTVCPSPAQITGEWTVTGGTGAFLNATGSGTEEGKQSFTGNDPVVDRLQGTLSYEEPGTPPSLDCYLLLSLYDQAFREAYVSCDPLENPQSQCKKQVMSSLVCGCPYYVDQSSRRALEMMRTVQQAFCDGACNRYWSCTDHFCGLEHYGDICVDGGP